jgi:hypothetical protein
MSEETDGDGSNTNQPDPRTLIGVGVAFMGAGVALMASAGPGMVGLLVLGVVFMITGARRMREESNDD